VFANVPERSFGPLGQKSPDRGGFELASKITAARSAASSRPVEQQPRESAASQAAEALTHLSELRERGILTDEEFTTKKAEILDRL
jgi:Short C-terminal domain